MCNNPLCISGLLARALCAVLCALLLGACVSTTDAADEDHSRERRAAIRMELAMGYLGRGQLDVALNEVGKALALDPKSSAAHSLQGIIYTEIGDRPSAEASFRRAVALNPRDGDAQHNLGWTLCENAQYAQGLAVLEQALTNPYYRAKDRSRAAKGLCQLHAGDESSAEATLKAAYDETESPLVANGLAELYAARGQLEQAASYARQATGSNAASAASLWLGAKIEHRRGNREGAQRYGRRLQEEFAQTRERRLYDRGAWNE